ncbi:hypothetical protein N0V90_007405 [Kalmusia sp. IMI 367209]|nr:hypothetical protein N0V90_007405 [Kalmusia sp. IMI 367209]
MPVDRRKKTKTPKEVPDPGDPDRKRVLNVLAQRRYQAQAEAAKAPPSPNETPEDSAHNQPKSTTNAASGQVPDESDMIEDIIREPISHDANFVTIDFDQEVFDMQLLEDLSESTNSIVDSNHTYY